MGTAQCPLQLLDPLLLLGIGPRGCASPPQRSLGSGFHFVFPAVIEIGSDLVLAAGLSNVGALQTFQHNQPLLFRGSLDSGLSRHSRLLAEAPSLTNSVSSSTRKISAEKFWFVEGYRGTGETTWRRLSPASYGTPRVVF